MGFIDTLRAEGHTVESIRRVLSEQGCQIAARTYRACRQADRAVAARTMSDAAVVEAVRDLAWTTDRQGQRRLAPEGLYGRRLPHASAGSVDRAMRLLGLSGVRRDTKVRTTIPAKDGKRAGDLLDRDFTAPAPNRVSDHRLQLLPQLGRLGLRGLHRRRVRPADCGLARRHDQDHRPGDDPPADRAVAA